MLESSFSRVQFVYFGSGQRLIECWKVLFKSSIRFLGWGQGLIECWKARFQEFDSFLGSGQRLIECWKARFQEFDSFSWFRATTDRMLESSFSRVRFVFLVQSNDWSNVGKLIFKSSIRFLGSGQRLIECWKAHFQEFDSFSCFRATTDRMLESSFSRVRFVFLVQGNDWSNVGKLIFKSSIRFLGSGQRLIECWKARFQEFDSFSWFKAKTDRMLESSFSRVRFVFFSRCPETRKRIELLKMSFPTFDQSLPWTKKTNRTLENELSNIRSVFALNQENESNSWKRAFQHSISRCPEPSKRIELLKMSFLTLDQSLPWTKKTNRTLENELSNIRWFRATTDRMLESSFSSVRFVFLVQGNDWSNVGKLVFKSSIRFLGSGQRLIERWKAHFQEFDSFSWFRATTDRALESSFSRVRFVFLVQGNDWSSLGKLVFKSSIRFLGSGQRLIECWKARFQEFDSFSWFRARTDRVLESSFSRVRFVSLVQGNDWSSVGKLIFKSSIRFLGSGQRLIECWKAHFQEFDSFTWFRATTDRMLESSFSRVRFVFLFRATTDRMLESSFSRVRFVYLVQGKDWSNVGKLIFKSSIRFLGSGQWLIECWKAHFQEFDSFSWFRATTDRMLESSFSRVRFVYFGSGQRLIECWKAHFQEFDSFSSVVALNKVNESNSWKRAFQHSISRCPEPRKRIELLKMSFPTFDQSLPWTKKTNRTLENELSNARWFRATTDRMLESSFSRVRFVFLVQGNDWSSVGKLIFKSSIRFLQSLPWPRKRIELLKMSFPTFDQSLPWTKKTNRTLENELSNARSVVALNQENESNSWKRAFQRSISRCPEPRKRIELLKMSFPTLDQSLPWTEKTNRTLENELSNARWFRATTDRMLESSFSRVRLVYYDQGNDWSNVGKLVFKSSIRLLQSLPWTKKTNRTLENELSNIRSVVALNQVNESNSWKRAFQHSISRCPDHSKLIELLKTSFPTFDQSLPWTKKTNRTLENEFSNIRSVLALNQENESNSWKLSFPTFDGSGQRLIECWKARFQEFDSFSWFRATTDRMLESSFSRVRFVFLVQGNDWSNVGKLVFKNSIRFLVQGNNWSNVGKLIFKSSIRFLGSGQQLIECWKARFQEFDSFSSVVALNQENESNSWKRAFQHSISRCPEPRKRIELLKTSFPTFDQLLPWTKKTNRTLENELSNIRSVVALNQETNRILENELSNIRSVIALNQENESNSWKWAFQHSISRCPEPRKRIELLKMSFPTFDQLLPWTKKTNQTLENDLSNIRSVLALNQENESNSWKWVFQHSMVQGNDWSSVGKLIFKSSIRFLVQGKNWSSFGKLIFKSSIRFLGSGQRLIECWKARFQEFDSFTWFKATTDRMLESSFSRVRFVFLVQGNDWSNVKMLVFKSSIRLLVQGNDWSNVGKLVFKSSIRFLGSGQRLIECWKARFQEFDSFSWFRATTDRMLESSFSRVRFVFLVEGKDWSNVGKLVFKSSIRFLGSGQGLIERLKAHFQEFNSFNLVQGNDWSNVGKLIFKSSIRFLGSGQRLIECWKAHFQEFDSFSCFRATTDRMLESSFSRVRFVFLVQGNDWSNVGKLIFKSSIRFLGSGQRLIECWKARFQEFDSFSWFKAKTDRMLESSFSRVRFVFLFRATTDRMLESSFSRVRFVFLVQGKDWSSVGKLIFKSSIRLLGSGQRLIECWKAHFQEFDSFTLVQGNDWSNVGKLVFKSSIRFLGSGQRLIECWKAHFQEFDSFTWFRATTDRMLESSFSSVRFVFFGLGQRLIECWKARFQEFDSFSWFRARTARMLESSFSRVRFVFLVQGNDWSNVGKLIFKSSIRFLGSGQRLIERWKAHFQEFDSFSWFRATTDRALESSFSRVRFVFLVQGNDWSSLGKLVFKSSIRFLGSGQRLIECWKAHFQEFDSFSWFRATTDRMLESSFSRVRFVFLVQGNDWSNVGKLIFKSSIHLLGIGQRLIERWKAHFQEFDSFSWFRATTDRMLESSFSRVRFVFLVQGNDWSNVGKLIFKSSIRFLGSGQRLIECWKTRFQEFDSFSSVVALNQENESNSWKWAFQHSISRCPEPRKRIELLKTSFPTLDQSLPWTKKTNRTLKNELSNIWSVVTLDGSGQRLIECWGKAHFQEFDSFSWFRATTDRVLESSFSRVRFVFLVQGNDWSSVGKLIFKSSIRFLGSGQRLIECWKAHFQEFDSFSWFRAMTDRMLESSFSRVRFVFLVQGKDWSSIGKLIFKSSIRFLGSGQGLIERWKAHFKSSIRFLGSGQRFQGNEWSSVGKLIFKSSIRFLGSGQRLIECWKARFQEFDSFTWFRATTDRMLESSFSRVRFVFLVQLESSFSRVWFVFLVQGNDWSNVGKLIFKSSIRFLVQGNDWSNVGKLIFKSSIRFLGSEQRLIECWKARFQEFDSFSWFDWKARFQEFDSFTWFRATTDRMLESSFSRVRFVFLVQGNDWSNVGKLIFKSSIRLLGSGQRLIERWKAHFQEFDSFSCSGQRLIECWKARFQEFNSFSSVVALNQENESNSWKWAFQRSISRCPEPRKRIELLKTSFPTFDQSLPWTKKRIELLKTSFPTFDGSGQRLIECWKTRFQEFDSFSWFRATTDRMLESSFSRVRFVFFSRCPEPRKRIELLKTSFPTLDQSLPWTKKTNRTLENELSNIRSVVALNQLNELNSWKWAFQRSISPCPEPRKRIELLKTSFPTFDQSLPWTKKTNRTLENELCNIRSVVALNRGNESNSRKRAFQHSMVQGNDWSSVGKLIFKSSIRFLGSGQRLIERWKAHFQEFDSFSWFRATTDRMLESSFSRVRFVFLVQGNDWSNVGKLIFKSSIRFLGSEQGLIEHWKAHFQEFDSFSWFRARDWSNVGKLIFKSSIRFLGSGQRFQGNEWSSVGKLIFKSSIRFLGSGQRLIECWKARFQEFDSFTWFRATTDRMLESSFSRVRFVFLVQLESSFSRVWFVFLVQGNDWSNVGKLIFKSSIRFLVQGNDWSNVGKLIFKSSIRFLGSEQRLIECWKARFQEFDSFSWFDWKARFQEFDSFTWFRATTDRMLESSFSRVRFVFLVQGNDWSNVGKLIFKGSIRLLGSGQRLIERWKAHFQEFDSFSCSGQRLIECWKARFQEFNSFSSVVALNQENESNSWKWAFQRSISRCPEPRKRIELLKTSFPTFDQSLPWTKKRIELLKTSFPTFDGSGQRLIECWKTRFQEFDSFSWFRATTDRMLESSFSRVRFVFLVQGNDWSSVGKLIFKSSIRLIQSLPWTKKTNRTLENELSNIRSVVALNQLNELNSWKWAFQRSISRCPEPRKRIELLKTSFPTFDQSLPWTKKTNRTLENELCNIRSVVALNRGNESNSRKRAFQHSMVQGNDWSNVGKLIFKSSIRFLGSGQRLIECWKAHFQEFDSFSWFRATTDRMLESSFSRVRFVFLVQGNDWSNVGKLVFKSSIRFLGSGQRLIECWKAHFQEFDSFSWFRATTDRVLESSFSRVRFVFFSRCPEPRKRIELLKMSFPTFDQSLPWTKKTNRTLENELSNTRWFRATTDRALRLMSFPTFDQS